MRKGFVVVVLFFCFSLFATDPESADRDCSTTVTTESPELDDRIEVTGFDDKALENEAVQKQIEKQRAEAKRFLAFAENRQTSDAILVPPKNIEIRPAKMRAPWTAALHWLAGRPYRVLQYPDTDTLIIQVPWYPIFGYCPLTSENIREYFYRAYHMDRLDRLTVRTRRRLRDLGKEKKQRIEQIREQLTRAAKSASAKIEKLLKDAKDGEGLGASAIRVNIAGLLRGEATLSSEDSAYIEGWDVDVLLKLLDAAKGELDSGDVVNDLVSAVEGKIEAARAEVTRNVWDWRVTVAPIIVRSQDIGQIHVWSEDPAVDDQVGIQHLENKVWFIHLNLGWVVIDTLDDYDIRVMSRITVNKGAEMLIALRSAIAQLKKSHPISAAGD